MDNKGRKLSRGLKHNDNPSAAMAHAARTGDVDLLVHSIGGALSSLPITQQRRVLKEVADIVAASTRNIKSKQVKTTDTTKAFEIYGPDIGQVTLEEFVSIVAGAVDDALNGITNDKISYTKQRTYSQSYRLTDSQLRKHISDVFEKYSGDIVISCSSPIRVYALHDAPSEEEKARRKKQKELAKAQEQLEKKREALAKAAEKEKKLKAELAKLAKDEARYKKSVEKAEKQLENLKDDKPI